MASENPADVSGKWYNVDAPQELHDDLRRLGPAAHRHARRRPSVARHMEKCEICRELTGQWSAEIPDRSLESVLRLKIDHAELRMLLELPDELMIVHVYATDEPNEITVLLARQQVADGTTPPTS